jgi:hypothetical protein
MTPRLSAGLPNGSQQEIGVQVFDRRPDYDTSHDTLVRVRPPDRKPSLCGTQSRTLTHPKVSL